jgi:hypothetical protein
MLTITIDGDEFFNDDTQEFEYREGTTLNLEHSLVSLSKWESKFQRPFLASNDKSPEEVLTYIKFMTITPNVDLDTIHKMSQDNLKEINDYIESPQSATTFGSLPKRQTYHSEVITSELIYYWMIGFNIPFECENWHLNRLFSLIRICNLKNNPQKMSKGDIARRNRELNAQRKAQLGTSG